MLLYAAALAAAAAAAVFLRALPLQHPFKKTKEKKIYFSICTQGDKHLYQQQHTAAVAAAAVFPAAAAAAAAVAAAAAAQLKPKTKKTEKERELKKRGLSSDAAAADIYINIHTYKLSTRGICLLLVEELLKRERQI